jgi:transposase
MLTSGIIGNYTRSYKGRKHMLLKTIAQKTLGLKNHKIERIIESANGTIEVYISPKKRRLLHSKCCKIPRPVVDVLPARKWRHISLWGRKVMIIYTPCRVMCCGKLVVEDIPWSIGKCRLSTPLICYISMLAELLAWKQVADLFNVHWNTVRNAVCQAVAYGIKNRGIGKVLYFGIDELSRKKGHVYLTNVYDLKEKRLLWSGEGRGEDTIKRFYAEWGHKLTLSVIGICCDMWQPYIDTLTRYFPDAVIVFDKFHIISHLHKAVDEVRKEEARELKKTHPDILKGTRYIWLKNPWNLTEKQKHRLSALEKMNLKINRAYLLKESFQYVWNYSYAGCAKKFLKQWFWWATHSRLKPLRDFAWMLRRHEQGIVNYFRMPISNGIVEGLNNKAKVVSHRAYGFRTAETYKLALYHCLGKLPRPETNFKFL